jgi:hypothetical protein
MTSGFERLERADNWWNAVADWVRRESGRVGFDDWNYAPEVRRRRERSARLLRRAHDRVTGELARLDASGAPEHVTRDRLHDNRRARSRARSTRARG